MKLAMLGAKQRTNTFQTHTCGNKCTPRRCMTSSIWSERDSCWSRSESQQIEASSTRPATTICVIRQKKPPRKIPLIRSRPPTKVHVRRTKNKMAQEQDISVRPEICFSEEPVGASFLRHSSEPVPAWFFRSRADTFWGASIKGKPDRKLDLVRFSDFPSATRRVTSAAASLPEQALIAHRIPPPPPKPKVLEFPPLKPGEVIHWHSLPMMGELEKYTKMAATPKGRQGAFTRYVGAVEPGKYRTIKK